MPDASPGPSEHVLRQDRERMADGEELEDETRTAEEIEEALQAKAAESRAQVDGWLLREATVTRRLRFLHATVTRRLRDGYRAAESRAGGRSHDGYTPAHE